MQRNLNATYNLLNLQHMNMLTYEHIFLQYNINIHITSYITCILVTLLSIIKNIYTQ